jgi:hypothetical protein
MRKINGDEGYETERKWRKEGTKERKNKKENAN